jgi:hypothetical protein
VGSGKGKTEGGHKRGHSAMALWVAHQETKTAAGKQRRLAARRLERKAAKETRGVASTRPSRGRDGRMARPPDQMPATGTPSTPRREQVISLGSQGITSAFA